MKIINEIITIEDLEVRLEDARNILKSQFDHVVNCETVTKTDIEQWRYDTQIYMTACENLIDQLKFEQSWYHKIMNKVINRKKK